MGWSFAYSPRHGKAATVAELRSPSRFAEGTVMLQASTVGNHHWYLAKTGDVVWIGLDLLQGGGKGSGWGYKSLSESCGPYYWDCPVSYLDKAPLPAGEFSQGWRDKVRKHHADKAARTSFKPGTIIAYGQHAYELMHPEAPRKGWAARRVSDGVWFRIKASQLAKSVLA